MTDSDILKISHIETSTPLLGPYNRYVIWVHGCCFDCQGCVAQNTRFGPFDEMAVSALAKDILSGGCEGITISGGEPFLQAEVLARLVQAVRTVRDIGVIVYSGFTLTELQAMPECAGLLAETDILIDGRYIQALDDGAAYIGSSNQQIHYLTDRYKAVGEEYYSRKGRRAEIKITPDQAILVGVPSKEVLKVWREIRQKGGGSGNEF